MAQKSPKSPSLGQVLPLELEARLAAHCAAWGEPAADVVADAVALLLDGFEDGIADDVTPADLTPAVLAAMGAVS